MDFHSDNELIDAFPAVWPEIVELIGSADDCQLLPDTEDQGRTSICQVQYSAGTWLGAVALNCGGIIAGSGWFRILGAGYGGLPGLGEINQLSIDPAD